MIWNYFKIAWRNLWKNKFYTLINISGLAVGLATSIMLLLWVQNELSFDKFHKDYQNIYKLSSHFKSNGEDISWSGVPGPLAVFAQSFPEVKSIVRIQTEFNQVLSNTKNKKILDGNLTAYVDNDFLSIFNFPLLNGNKKTALFDKFSIVITASTAQKLFGNNISNFAKVMGKTIVFKKQNFTVTGILQDFPKNSSLHFDALFSMRFYAQLFTTNGGNGDWKTINEDMGNFSFDTFVKLRPNTNPIKIGQKFTIAYKKARNDDADNYFKLQNLASIHLTNADGNSSSLRMVQIFMLVVVLLLAIASINYVNLSTARSLLRVKEIGVRKIIGAHKTQLFLQFTIETILLFCFAVILSIGLIYLLMPLYNTISGSLLIFNLSDLKVSKLVGLAILGTLVASSIYPALLLSSFKPVEALKGKLTSSIGVTSFRKALVIFQFSISIILIICTIIMGNQIKFIKNKDLGFDKSYVFTVQLPNDVVKHLDAVKTELMKTVGILNVSATDAYNISDVSSSTGDIEWEGKPANSNMIISQVLIDTNFIPTMKMKIIEGNNFNGSPTDSTSYILNETAVQKMGLKPPYVGRKISFHNRNGTIIGIVKDFNFKNLKEKIAPILFYSAWYTGNILYVRTKEGNTQQAITSVENQYKKYAGGLPFKYTFLDKEFDEQYKSDQRSGILFSVFSVIAIFISCLGLFGLSAYTAQIKKKEIGIRKVLGANVGGIIKLISNEFLKLVVIAIFVGSPIAWYLMYKWLQYFAYRISLEWWAFALAGILAMLIAFVTISFQSIKAAIANPVKSLRTE